MIQEELKLQKQEIYTLNLVKHEFNELMDCISQRNTSMCKNVVKIVESMLLTHKIRGNTVMDDLEPRFFCSGSGDENGRCFRCLVEDPPTSRKVESQVERSCTMESAYHLVPDIMALCDEDDVPNKTLAPVRNVRRLKLAGSLENMLPQNAEKSKVLVKESKSLSNFDERHHVWR